MAEFQNKSYQTLGGDRIYALDLGYADFVIIRNISRRIKRALSLKLDAEILGD